VRLAAVHSFFQYLATVDPRHLLHCQSILAVPFKRRAHRIPEYLERSEIQSLFAQINCHTLLGQRDDALAALLPATKKTVTIRLPAQRELRLKLPRFTDNLKSWQFV
jgi:site-specific recombinase XerD